MLSSYLEPYKFHQLHDQKFKIVFDQCCGVYDTKSILIDKRQRHWKMSILTNN